MTDYRGLILENTREGATDPAIAQLEASLGARLPEDYRQFLKTCNGAHVEYDVPATLANGDEKLLSFRCTGWIETKSMNPTPSNRSNCGLSPAFP